jgi:hypothetical protein
MSGFAGEWYNWLELDEKWLPGLTESLNKIEIDGQLQKMSWEEQLEYLVPCWIEKVTKLASNPFKKVTKSEKPYRFDIQNNDNISQPSLNEKVTKLSPSPNEKPTKLYGEKGTSRDEKGHKLESAINADYLQYDSCEDTSTNEKGYKLDDEKPINPHCSDS